VAVAFHPSLRVGLLQIKFVDVTTSLFFLLGDTDFLMALLHFVSFSLSPVCPAKPQCRWRKQAAWFLIAQNHEDMTRWMTAINAQIYSLFLKNFTPPENNYWGMG